MGALTDGRFDCVMAISKFNKGERLYWRYCRLIDEGKLEEAEHAIQASLVEGEPMAMHAIAYRLDQTGKASKIKEALHLYRKAAKLGFGGSAWNLARHYDLNQIPRSYFHWLRRSAELGEDDASAELSNPFPYTVATALELLNRDHIKEAKRLLRFAAKHGNSTARDALEELES